MANRLSVLVLGVVVVLASCASAQEKKSEPKTEPKDDGNTEKLIGLWEMQDADLAKIDGKATFEFARDGKAKMSVEIGKQKPILIEGTFKVDGDKVTLTARKGDKDATEVVAIKSVSSSELVLLDNQKKEVKFKKPEAKDATPKDALPKSPFPKSPFPKDPF